MKGSELIFRTWIENFIEGVTQKAMSAGAEPPSGRDTVLQGNPQQ